MMELQITNPKQGTEQQPIEFNYDELKKELGKALHKYQSLVYTQENVGDAKKTLADLRKLKRAIEDRRKEVKAYCLKPYEDFEKKVKDLTGMIEKPISLINVQVQDFEEQRRGEKMKACKALYERLLEGYEDLKGRVSWEDVEHPSFGNVTKTEAQIEKEITEFLDQAKGGVEVIKAMKTKYEFELLEMFFKSYNIGDVLSEKSRLEDIERRKMAEEEARKQEQESKPRSVSEPFKPITAPDTLKAEKPSEAQIEDVERFSIKFMVTGSRDQLMSLSQFMRTNGIEFTQVR